MPSGRTRSMMQLSIRYCQTSVVPSSRRKTGRPRRCSTSLAELPIRLSGSSSGGSSGAGWFGCWLGFWCRWRNDSSNKGFILGGKCCHFISGKGIACCCRAGILSSAVLSDHCQQSQRLGLCPAPMVLPQYPLVLLLPIFSGDFSAGMGGRNGASVASPSAVTQPDSSNKPIRGRPMTWTAERWRRMIMENAEKENNLQAGFQ